MRKEILPADRGILSQIALRLDRRQRRELLANYHSHTDWVRSRLESPGSMWAFLLNSQPIFVLGVASHGESGWVWLAGAEGWTRHAKYVIRLWRAIVKSGAYTRYLCDVRADDEAAQRSAEHAGFHLFERRGPLLYYRTAP